MSKNFLNEIQNARHADLLKQRQKSLQEPTPFSLELAGHLRGVRMVNDSSATTPVRVADALASFSRPLVWIAEANAFTSDFSPLAHLAAEKAKVVIVNGPRAEEVFRQLWPTVPFFLSANSWEEALDLALISADANDTVLFSPGCRAAEPFANYKERGAYFNRLIDIKRTTNINIA
jgi:UDP-N-acetylmuramoylalanine--D-glutamate ligase